MQQQWAEVREMSTRSTQPRSAFADRVVSQHEGVMNRLLDRVLRTQPSWSCEYWVLDAVVRVAGESDGDGVAGAPEDFLHPVQVLRA